MHYSISEIEIWLNVYSLNLGVVSLHNLKQKIICEGSDSLKDILLVCLPALVPIFQEVLHHVLGCLSNLVRLYIFKFPI